MYQHIRLAGQHDIHVLVELINLAYRSDQGWTHEHGIVCGDRINEKQLKAQLTQENFKLYVFEQEGYIHGCIGLTITQNLVEIGSFAMHPTMQNQGVGKQLLKFAEYWSLNNYPHLKISMSVLSIRSELIAYYLRRGYQHTDQIEAYPLDADVGTPIVPLHLIILEKHHQV